MTIASAAGKVILLGEHAVVYGRPAIAVPISDVRATVEVTELRSGEGISIVAEDLEETYRLDREYDAEAAYPLQTTVRNTLEHLGIDIADQALRIVVRSDIPIARGMGSGTAVATALVRALAGHFQRHLTSRAISDLVYETEVIFHGAPSGVDNTVVAFEKPVYFLKGERTDVFWVGQPFALVIADTGVPSRTRDAVQEVARKWSADRRRYDDLFDQIGAAVTEAKRAIAEGELRRLGQLMNRNQDLLHELGVSSPELDRLVGAARGSGAMGAKLSGGGMGGCMIALVDDATTEDVISSLLLDDAHQVVRTTVH